MATSVVPALINALAEASADALPNTLAFFGPGNTDDPGDYLMVGVSSPEDAEEGFADAAEFKQTWAGLGAHARDEEGEIWCAAESRNGDGDVRGACDDAFATVAAVENLCRNNPTMGVLTSGWVSVLSEGRLQMSSDNGAAARVIFKVQYKGRI